MRSDGERSLRGSKYASETARVFQQRAARRIPRFHGAHRETQTPDGCAPTPWCRVRERQGRVTHSIAGRGMVFASGSESVGKPMALGYKSHVERVREQGLNEKGGVAILSHSMP